MAGKPIDPIADANRALAVALAALVLLVAVAFVVTQRGADPHAANTRLSVSPLPTVTEPQRRAAPKRDGSATTAIPRTTTTLRETSLGDTCLTAYREGMQAAAAASPRFTFPTVPFPTFPPPATTTVPTTVPPTTVAPTTVPRTTVPPTTPSVTTTPPTAPPPETRPGPTVATSPPKAPTRSEPPAPTTNTAPTTAITTVPTTPSPHVHGAEIAGPFCKP